MKFTLPMTLVAGALAIGLAAGGPAVATGPGVPPVVAVQAETTSGWTQHTTHGLEVWLPAGFELAFDEEDGVVFRLYDQPGLGVVEIVITDHPDAHDEIMDEMESLPADTPITRTSRTIGSLGGFEQIDMDLTGDAEDPATVSILVAGQAGAGTGRLVFLALGLSAMDGTTPDWDRIRAMIDEIMARITDAAA